MCGIAGVVSSGGAGAPGELERMLAAQWHRGPEGSATDRLGDALFGACTLSFVERQVSRQPARSRDGRVLVVFNGEIYNHRELRAELSRDGAPCAVPGEAALLAELYARQGLGMLPRLEGMFALAIHDLERRETVLVRDRFGKKPLYYLPVPGGVVFASELSALRLHPDCGTTVDPRALALYLTLNAVPAPWSLLAGVRKVPAGAAVRLRGSEVESRSWWTLRLDPRPEPLEPLLGELRRRLEAAVERRLTAEAPVGLLLSGGLDSGLLAAIARRLRSEPIRTYSAAFPDAASFDETGHAEHLARHLGTRHTTVPLDAAALAAGALEVLPALDEPVADQSLVPTYLLCRVARAEVKAVLTGDGADELLMGYRIFQAAALLRAAGAVVPPPLLSRGLTWLGRRPPADTNLHHAHVAGLLARTLGAPPERQFHLAAEAFPPADWAAVLTPETLAEAAGADPFGEIGAWVEAQPSASSAERLQLGMICHFLRDVILTKLDRASMLASIEARSPFLDHQVVDLLLRLPERAKMRRLTTKYLVKRLAEADLPRRLVHRRKQGFRVPTARLLRTRLREPMLDLLSPAALRRGGLLVPEEVGRLVAEHLAGTRDHHRRLWSLLCLQAWVANAGAGRAAVREGEAA